MLLYVTRSDRLSIIIHLEVRNGDIKDTFVLHTVHFTSSSQSLKGKIINNIEFHYRKHNAAKRRPRLTHINLPELGDCHTYYQVPYNLKLATHLHLLPARPSKLMGNTLSIAPNILVFPPPDPSKRRHCHCTYTPIHGSSPAVSRPSVPTYRPAPPTQHGEPLQNAAAKSTSLHCSDVTNSDSTQSLLLATLKSLCNALRDPSDRLARRAVSVLDDNESGWIPCAVFHVSGDFQNVHSNSVVSVLLAKPATRTFLNRTGEEERTGEDS